MMSITSVVLLSGGLDSAANLAIASERDLPVLALTFDYGQRALAGELRAAKRLSEYYSVRHRIIEIPWLKTLGQSRLTSGSESLALLQANELDDQKKADDSAKSVWVPNRNGILINIAAAVAEDLRAKRVVVGFNIEEASTLPYNTEAFMNAATGSLNFSTANHVEVFSYTVRESKTDIVKRLKDLKKPFRFDMIWSCYESGLEPCEKCESCLRLDRALRSAGVKR